MNSMIYVKPILEQVAKTRAIRTLAELRDALLPKLISGQIRVGEAQDIIEAQS